MKKSITLNQILLTTFVLLAFSLSSFSQETVVPAGGNASGTDGSVSYSVGQVFYNTSTGTNGSVAQGVQQPFEVFVVTSIKEAENISLMPISAYPNPTSDYLMLNIDKYNTTELSYQIFDINGASITNGKIEDMQTKIEMQNLPSSTYFIKIFDNNNNIKTFKIIKN